MAGLGKPMTQAAPAAPMSEQEGPEEDRTEAPGAEDAEGEDTEGGAGNVSPEEQKLYEDFVHSAMAVIYPGDGQQVAPQILADLKGQFDPQALAIFDKAEPALTDSPQDSAAATAVILVLMLDQKTGLGVKATEQDQNPNGPPPGEPDYAAVLLHGGKAIAEELLEVSEAAKIHDFNDQDIEAVWARANSLYLVAGEAMQAPGVNKDGLTREFGKLVDADKAGQLNKVLPGLPGGAPAEPAPQQPPAQEA